jgi:hypothetical protein
MTATRIDFEATAPSNVNGAGEPWENGPPEGFGDDEPATHEQPNATPTFEAPLAALPKLGAVAIMGRDRILELAAKPVVYIWQDIAIAGIIVVIAGGPGGGKTTLLFLILAARLNTGEPVKLLGREVAPAPAQTFVVLIEGEHGPTSTTRKTVRSFRLQGIDDAALERLIIVARKSVRIGSDEWLDVGRLVAAGLVSDIALDTLARVAPADGNDEREQVAIFDEIAKTIDAAPSEETKPVVWTVAHTRKGAGDDLEGVSGSTQRVGQADSVLMVQAERRDGRVVSSKVTFAKLREEPDEYPMPVEYTVTADKVVTADASAASDERPLEERILARLALGSQTKTALKTSLGRSDADIETAITCLFDARRIGTTTVTVRGKARKAFTTRDTRPV